MENKCYYEIFFVSQFHSNILVQVVDSRNPLLFRSEDLEKYVKETDENKENILLLNKADLLTENQRMTWAEYFKTQKVQVAFFSALLAQDEVM
jgi:large subunit GTPase 1